MAFEIITSGEIAAGQPVTQTLMQKVKDSLDYLYSQIGSGGGGGGGGSIPNGSFEIDADGDGVPDGWTKNLYPAGGGALETTSPMHGAKAYKFIQQAGPGNGGGYLDMDEYMVCAPGVPVVWSWLHYSSAAGMHNYVQVRWFDKAKVYVSTSDLYNSTTNPTSVKEFIRGLVPPATAQFYKLRIIGGYSDTDIAGTAYFDGFREISSALYGQDLKTIAEGYVIGLAFADAGSCTINLPILSINCQLRLHFTAELRVDVAGGFTASQRFRVGGAYSVAGTTMSETYVPISHEFTLPVGVSGQQTLYQQLCVDDSNRAAYGRKVDLVFAVEVLVP